MNEKLNDLVSDVLNLLVVGRYTDVEILTHGVRLDADEIARAIADYGKQLIFPPEEGFRFMDVVEVINAQPKRWSIAMPLWTLEEGRSDLTLEMTATEQENGFSISVDDLHVL
jgi:hypothetical protein